MRSAAAIVRVVVVAIVAVVLLVPILMPIVTGHRIIVVDGGSMAPTFDVGDVILTSAPTGDDLEVGRIVVVGTPGTLYTHRVLEVDRTGAEPRARLKGDANEVPDPAWIRQGEVYAVYLSHVEGPAAAMIRSVTTPPGTLVLLAVAVVLLLVGIRPPRTRSRHGSREPLNSAANSAAP
jgi:signal peptidase I